MKQILSFLLCLSHVVANAQCIHPKIGTKAISTDSAVTIVLIDRKQHFSFEERDTWDASINSPKSVNIHPNGNKFYVNSLEGATTVIYDFKTRSKTAEIRHQFDESADAQLWSKESCLFKWEHYHEHVNTFYGKPVESTFSHNGRYLWIPYYRRSFDINAQDPSAVAIIDTRTDSIVKLMETGPLPKMITTSPDGTLIAISHWGNNTVGLIDVSSSNPDGWQYECVLIVDHQLKLDYPLNKAVDRDNGSGYALRGTVFTPDNRYLLVGCMGGGGGIAVIDIHSREYLGRILGMSDNVRHLMLSNGYLYLSINKYGLVQRTRLSTFISAIKRIKHKVCHLTKWETCHVGQGARTISCTPNGRYIFAACNNVSRIYVIDTKTFKVICYIPADSYPVGLDVSSDGKYIFTTSQGRNNQGGNAVDIYEVTYRISQKDCYCINCGAEISDRLSHCPKCKLEIATYKEANVQTAGDNEKTDTMKTVANSCSIKTCSINGINISKILLISCALALVVGAIIFIKRNSKNS